MNADAALEKQFWPAPRHKAQSRKPTLPMTWSGQPRPSGQATFYSTGSLLRSELKAHMRAAPQVMVKITGGSRGMAGITAHLQYISNKGERDVEDQDGYRHRSAQALSALRDTWRDAGAQLPSVGHRIEAHHILLQMPAGTDARRLQEASRNFARAEFSDHVYAMARHTHQSTPHIHLIVRTETVDGRRLNPRKADLHRWRLRFAHELREVGIDAAASRQRTRGYAERHEDLWEKKVDERRRELQDKATRADLVGDPSQAIELRTRAGSLRTDPVTRRRTPDRLTARQIEQARAGWVALSSAMRESLTPGDKELAIHIDEFVRQTYDRNRREGPIRER